MVSPQDNNMTNHQQQQLMLLSVSDNNPLMQNSFTSQTPAGNYIPLAAKDSKFRSKTKLSKKDSGNIKFRSYQCEKWQERFIELIEYQKRYGNCLVPHYYSSNRPLARWVKRQRYQYNLLQQGKRSSITSERVKLLNTCGFVWDSHEAAWREKLQELQEYKDKYGTWMVPSHFPQNPKLANWAKNQRRQYKLYREGKPTTLSKERILDLEKVGFQWENGVKGVPLSNINGFPTKGNEDSDSDELPEIYHIMLDVLSILSSDASHPSDESEIVQEYIQQYDETSRKDPKPVPDNIYHKADNSLSQRDYASDISDDDECSM